MVDNSTATSESKQRRHILKKLGLDVYLKSRTCVDLGDLPVHCELYLSKPEDPVILFIPGIGTYSEIYAEFLFKFSSFGYNIISVDLRGHGYSGGIRGEYTVEEVIQDLTLVVDYLNKNHGGPIIVLGCSIGARLGLALAESDSRVKALICHTLFISEQPADFTQSMSWNMLSMSAMWMPGVKVDFRQFIDINDLLENNPMGQYAESDDLMVWEYTMRTLDSVFSHKSNILKQSLHIPAMIIVGEKDSVIRPDHIISIIKASKQPFDFIQLPGATHMLPFDHIEESINACNQWLVNLDL